MENLFEYDRHQEAMLWLAEELPIVNKSDFVRYTQQPMNFVSENSRNMTRNVNMNKRMIEFLKKSWEPQVSNAGISNEKERAYKHMINERMRRDKEKKNYQALHKILPLGTKVSLMGTSFFS
ncbi:hypothetical protein LIER_08162 [Lithospermum erythrorhizon]|uniref:Uncharacterized protein n=1 Tax=Lithospermum erythrorhizon TaxID=34254 RepID=A0AAV3PCX7_LITER